MKFKRYVAPNVRYAMKLIRDDFGDDAVIISNKKIAEGVEVIVATDPEIEEYREQVSHQAQTSAPKMDTYERPRPRVNSEPMSHSIPPVEPTPEPVASAQGYGPRSMGGHAAPANAEIQRMSDELKFMRSLLENQLSTLAWGQKEQTSPELINLTKRLLKLGFGWDFTEQLLQGFASEVPEWSQVLNTIEQQLPIEEFDLIDQGGIMALVGPTGVGKTTTIAKMASRFVMRNSPTELALVTTDCYKIGAQEQLKTFADLIQVPVYVAQNQGELYSLLQSLSDKRLVLIDTAGMSQRDLQLASQLTSGHLGQSQIHNYLVMSAGTQLQVMQDVVESFKQVVLKGCILTKVDEALQLGSVLTVLIQKQLPLSYMSTGQRVPEDLEKVRARELVDRVVVLGQQSGQETPQKALESGMGKEIFNA